MNDALDQPLNPGPTAGPAADPGDLPVQQLAQVVQQYGERLAALEGKITDLASQINNIVLKLILLENRLYQSPADQVAARPSPANGTLGKGPSKAKGVYRRQVSGELSNSVTR